MLERIEGQSAGVFGCRIAEAKSHVTVGQLMDGEGKEQCAGA